MATLTVKNIPDELYERLKAAAETNRRSLNSEIITRLERSASSRRVPIADILARVSRLHQSFNGMQLDLEQLDQARREGRP